MMDSVLAYIRSWFGAPTFEEVSRKRRATDNANNFGSPKYRKVLSQMDNFEDGSFTSPLRSMRRSSSSRPIIVLDDDVPACFKPSDIKGTNRFRSSKHEAPMSENTPLLNGNGDLSLTKVSKSTLEKQLEADRHNFAYITRFTAGREPITTKTGGAHNGARPKTKMSPNLKTPKLGRDLKVFSTPYAYSPSLDYSIRLDDKRKYKELLDNVALQDSFDSSSSYGTPVGQFYNLNNVSNRTKKILNMSRSPKQKPMEVVDLTRDSNLRRLSTKDTVIKVLDDFESEAAVIDDSDSDVEILPSPPSPKPDIKVDPINSLKTVVDTSKSTHQKWLEDYSEKHDSFVKTKTREIQAYSENSSTLNEINRDMLMKALTRKVQDCLAIKDYILPVYEEQEEIELPTLTDEQLRKAKRALSGDPNEVLTQRFSLTITRRDIQTLGGLNWLNDNVINFYMNLIADRGKNAKWPKSHCMNTFFYQKLSTAGPESLRRWTRKVDVFAVDFICVPIHLGMHWCMAIISFKDKSIKYYDSMGNPNNSCLHALKNYLEYEHMDKKNEPYSTKDFVLENVQDIPQQMNGSDCGMFACTFAEYATRNARFTFSQKDMPYLRKKMVLEILGGELLIR